MGGQRPMIWHRLDLAENSGPRTACGAISAAMNFRVCCLLVSSTAISASPLPVRAAEPSNVPILRIEAGMHTARINAISADAAGKVALTVSADKTARLWELPSGRPLRVFRPPVGEGREGELYTGALSPDGKIAAVGGWLGWEWNDYSSVLLFDTETGALVKKLGELKGDPLDLEFSPSGKLLAATLGDGHGLRIWDVASGRQVAQDIDYNEKLSHSVDWRGENELVTTCDDRAVRLYKVRADRLELTAKSQVSTGKEPSEARFQPGGNEIAVAFSNKDTPIMVVHDRDLGTLYGPAGFVFDGGWQGNSWPTLEWTSDGSTLVAGGWTPDANLGVWNKSGRAKGRFEQIGAETFITGMHGAGADRVLFSTALPEWGVANVKASDRATWKVLGTSPLADFSVQDLDFFLMKDGSAACFHYGQFDQFAFFFLNSRELRYAQPNDAPWRKAREWKPPQQKGLPVENIKPSPGLRFRGKPLPGLDGVVATCLTIAEDKSFFIVGIGTTLRRFSAEGEQTWQVETARNAAAVNVADGDRLVVVAYKDGTIRWHRADNGQELLAFFPHADQKHWVMWATEYERQPRPRIGIGSEDVEGKVVAATVDDGPAKEAGLQAGDRLLALAGQAITNDKAFSALVLSHRPGETITLKVQRGAGTLELAIKLGEQPEPLWIAKGWYYDASPGAEGFIGWHVNRGQNQAADFFSAGKFRETFCRPDVIDRVLQTRDVAEARRLADAARPQTAATPEKADTLLADRRPPVVELAMGTVDQNVTVAAGVPAITVRYKVRAGGGPTKLVRLFVDGRPTPVNGDIPEGDEVAVADVPLPPYDCTVSIIAENRFASSEPTMLRIKRGADRENTAKKPRLILLAIGLSRFADGDTLPYPAKDAADLVATMQKQEGRCYSRVESRLLTDEKATVANIIEGLDWVRQQTTPDDIAMVSVNTHGGNDVFGRFDFMAHDGFVGSEEILRVVKKVPGKVILFIDTCHSGNALERLRGKEGATPDVNRLTNELTSDENGAVVFTASTSQQVSFESATAKGGLFNRALIEGLEGKADLLGKGKITVASLETYIASRVPELFEEMRQADPEGIERLLRADGSKQTTQTPCVAKPQTVPDFTIAVRASGGVKQ